MFSANGNPIGDDGGIKVGARQLCFLVVAPQTIGCFYDRIMCARLHGCGLLPQIGWKMLQSSTIVIILCIYLLLSYVYCYDW